MTIKVDTVNKKVQTLKAELEDIKESAAKAMTEAAQAFIDAYEEWSEAEKFLSKRSYLEAFESAQNLFSDMAENYLIKEAVKSD